MLTRFLCTAFLIGLTAMPVMALEEEAKVLEDPWEALNRRTYKVNRALDRNFFKPVARGYVRLTPKVVRIALGNFYDNLREIPTFTNTVFQGRAHDAAATLSRFVVNSILGVGGLGDFAGALGLEKKQADFGQTLGRWGYTESRYWVIPIFGPSTVRDALGIGTDYWMSVYPYIKSDKLHYGLLTVDLIDRRSRFLDKEEAFNAAAVDEYIFVRNAYLQRRNYLIQDGSERSDDLEGYD